MRFRRAAPAVPDLVPLRRHGHLEGGIGARAAARLRADPPRPPPRRARAPLTSPSARRPSQCSRFGGPPRPGEVQEPASYPLRPGPRPRAPAAARASVCAVRLATPTASAASAARRLRAGVAAWAWAPRRAERRAGPHAAARPARPNGPGCPSGSGGPPPGRLRTPGPARRPAVPAAGPNIGPRLRPAASSPEPALAARGWRVGAEPGPKEGAHCSRVGPGSALDAAPVGPAAWRRDPTPSEALPLAESRLGGDADVSAEARS